MKFQRVLSILTVLSMTFYFGLSTCLAADAIEDGKKVKLHYTLSADGDIVDQTQEGTPFEYEHGVTPILPGLAEGLQGLQTGDHREIVIPPERGFGPINPDALVEVPRTNLPEGDIQIGSLLTTTGEEGELIRARVAEIREETALLDFNHPLAGKELLFEVDIIEVV